MDLQPPLALRLGYPGPVATLRELAERVTADNDARLGLIWVGPQPIPPAPEGGYTPGWEVRHDRQLADLGALLRARRCRLCLEASGLDLAAQDERAIGRLAGAIPDAADGAERPGWTVRLGWCAALLDALGCDLAARVVVPVGGGHGHKGRAAERFARRWALLPERVRRRLALRNDATWSLANCLRLHAKLGVPLALDVLALTLAAPADGPRRTPRSPAPPPSRAHPLPVEQAATPHGPASAPLLAAVASASATWAGGAPLLLIGQQAPDAPLGRLARRLSDPDWARWREVLAAHRSTPPARPPDVLLAGARGPADCPGELQRLSPRAG